MNSKKRTFKAALMCGVLISMASFASSSSAQTQDANNSTNKNVGLTDLMGLSGVKDDDKNKVAYVREQILKEAATAMGARVGLSERSKELLAILDIRSAELDSRFNFNPLVIGANVLPPVISESRDVISLEAASLRVAGALYQIDEPARFALPTPTWRDWLYTGLDAGGVKLPSLGSSLPETEAERVLWKSLIKEAYEEGRKQAQASFEANLAHLERSHAGMRRYYELWRRGMVSAPIVSSASEIVLREDDRTISVGNTMYRITAPTDFRTHNNWVPLE
jgi:defect in organelle trafficking protein DotC